MFQSIRERRRVRRARLPWRNLEAEAARQCCSPADIFFDWVAAGARRPVTPRALVGPSEMDVSANRRVALVTGSSRGLGREIARRLAAEGHMVAVNDSSGGPDADDVATHIRDSGGIAEAFGADVTDESDVADLVEGITGSLGPIDVLVVNATGAQPEAPVTQVRWEDHLEQLEFFVKSPVLLGRAAVPGMRERGFGRIIQIDSEVADRPPPGRSAYATAKSAQIGLTRAWARELAPLGITVNAVTPGFVPVERHSDVGAEIRDAYVASVPVGRIGTREDIASAVSFLASDAAGFVTGQRLIVDGGRSLFA